MKKLIFLIPILLILACSEHQIYFSGSVGIYPDRIFWAFIENPPPDFGIVDDAKVILDSIYRIPYDGEKYGYYKEGIYSLTYNSIHTVQVEVKDKENIYGTAEIPSYFTIDIYSLGDSLYVEWTHADSLETQPDIWRVIITQQQDTIYNRNYNREENTIMVYPIASFNEIEAIIEAIRYGDLSGDYGSSIFAGIVRRKKSL